MSPRGPPWTLPEVAATVADYRAMLRAELRGERFNKSAHRRALAQALDDRSEGAIERKHQNISAILIDLGCPYIEGYKPPGHYQRLLRDEVVHQLEGDAELRALVREALDRPAPPVPTVDELLRELGERMVSPPKPRASQGDRWDPPREGREPGSPTPEPINYLEQEARNRRLGRAGEEFVLNLERARLVRIGEERLADRVEHVADTSGDHEGFDVLSFEPDGRERLIEVKTTGFGKETPFFVSRNQVEVSARTAERYHLYRVFRFRKDPRLFSLQGALQGVCFLDPTEYRGTVA